LRMIHRPVTGAPCWLGHPVRLSDGRHVTPHPLLSRNGVIAIRVRLGVIGCVDDCGLNQSTGQLRHRRRTLHDRPDHHDGRERRFRSFACGMIVRSGASHEVLSPSALAGRVALCRAGPADSSAGPLPASARSRFGVSFRPPALCGLTVAPSPLRSFAIRSCRGDARVTDEPA